MLIPLLILLHSELVDVMPEHWAARAVVQVVQEWKVMSAYQDHTFRGSRPVSRYVLLVALKRVMEAGGRTFTVSGPVPPDIGEKHWARASLQALSGQALFTGWLDQDRFQGDQAVTRGDLAKALSELILALNMPAPPATDKQTSVPLAVRYGLLATRPNGEFDGKPLVTRYELAAVLQKVLVRLVPPPAF